MDRQKCETCRFWLIAEGEPDYEAGEPQGGDCRRFPTRVARHALQWCGEYQPENPETVTEGAATLARLVLLGDMTAARALADKLREEG